MIIDVIDKAEIPESLFGVIADIIAFGEAERQRQSILIKDLRFYANDFMPKKKHDVVRKNA